jgi:hypothetical protein
VRLRKRWARMGLRTEKSWTWITFQSKMSAGDVNNNYKR